VSDSNNINKKMSHHSLNQLCVIEGDYNLTKYNNPQVKPSSPSKKSASIAKLNELVEAYKSKYPTIINESETELMVIHSKDGSELCMNLLNSFGLSSNVSNQNSTTLSTTLNEFDLTTTTTTTLSTANTNQRYVSSSLTNFVCFIIPDFDQSDKVFLKLEETQSKLTNLFNNLQNQSSKLIPQQKRFMIFGWPVLNYCLHNNINLVSACDVERPLYSKIMSGCFVCFTGFKKENKNTVAHCIKLVHYMGGSVRKEYNKKITHLIVKSTLSTKYKTAYNIGRCHLLTEEWIIDTWKHRNEVDFNVNNEEFLKKFQLKALYSLSIAFYGFTSEETQHMKEVTIENGGTPVNDLNDPQCTHIVINDQEIKQLPTLGVEGEISGEPATTPTTKIPFQPSMSPFSNTRASVVRAEWFWASIQICCRASECLYEFTKPKITETCSKVLPNNIISQPNEPNPPNKRIKLSSDNLLSHETLNSSNNNNNNNINNSHVDSPHFNNRIINNVNTPTTTNQSLNNGANAKTNISSNNLLQNNDICDSPTVMNNLNSTNPNNTINNRLSTGVHNNRNNMSNNNLSTSASLLDATTDDAMSIDSPFEKQRENHGLLNSASSNGAGCKKMNKRSQRIYELYETEKRFVNILHTIIYFFKEPIESPDQVAGPILDQTECKEIFGNLPPIYEVHCKIKDRLERLANRININEENISVGEIYLDNSDALLKTYPPFVNFYEKTKDAILNCDKIKPRFHAFLKIAQSKPECGRQTLVELLIRPVQRLPSTLLLLDDILKETPKGHRDHELLTKAIASLKEVMTHINEDKRKIENQLAMFVLINDIENCPATLLSSHRSFLKKIDVYETSSELLKKGAQLTLFLFTDCLEICKPRLKLINAAKSPNAASKQRTPQKCYKHIALFSLNNVTKVCDILQNNDDTDLFGILCRLAGEKDKFFSFKVIPTNGSINNACSSSNQLNGHSTISSTTSTLSTSSASSSNTYGSSIYASTTNLNLFDENHQAVLEKKEYIKLIAQGICNVKCITEYENILCTIEAKQLQIDLNESGGVKKLDAVKSYARIINRRVSRAFSFSQDTPNKIKKTISSVFRSPFQSSYSQQSLNEQKASKLTSLASLQLTPTLMETKRRFITLQKSRDTLLHPFFSKQQTLSNINTQTTSSLLSLDNCMTTLDVENNLRSNKIPTLLERTLSSNKFDDEYGELNPNSDNLGGNSSSKQRGINNDITNLFPSNSVKRQFT
jgi:hypothetical protein